MNNEIKIQSLTHRFEDQESLQNISATIFSGQVTGLAGPDGAGKTTLLRLIAGLLIPTTGSISAFGLDSVTDAELIHETCGYMPQKFGLYEDLTVEQNLKLYAELRGLEKEKQKKVFDELLAFTALGPFTKRLAGKLSGGMKQKLGLACALIKKPKLLLLDEPGVGVDPISRRQLWKMVQELVADDIAVIWSTAYLDEAEKCASVLLLNEGKLLFHGLPNDLAKRCENRVFLVRSDQESSRKLLEKSYQNPDVIDGVIQGKSCRIVVRKGATYCSGVKTKPSFEDGFIDILGGFQGGHSQLAAKTDVVSSRHENMIEITDLTKRFGSFTAVDSISLQVKKGEIFGLLGPNGAGKTTTFKMMCGLLKPTTGAAFVNGVSLLTSASQARSQIGYMAQKFSLYGNLTVRQNLEFFSGVYNLSNKAQKMAIEEVVEIFDLQKYLAVNAELLPLGFKQRLALSCAVMHRPMILFLDEPTSGVDPLTRREFWSHINGLVEKGVTVMVTTHFMDEAEYCDRIALIYKGTRITLGTPDELKERVQKKGEEITLEDAFIRFIEAHDEGVVFSE